MPFPKKFNHLCKFPTPNFETAWTRIHASDQLKLKQAIQDLSAKSNFFVKQLLSSDTSLTMTCSFRIYANSEDEVKSAMQSDDRVKIIEMCNRSEGTCFSCPFRLQYTKDTPADMTMNSIWTLGKHESRHMHPLNIGK